MDWSLYDQEGAMRQRYLDIDERTEEVRERVEKSTLAWDAFQEMLDISWLYHENGLEGVVLTFPEIRSAVGEHAISDVSLMPTYQIIKAQKRCMDLMREKAASKRFSITIPFLRDMHTSLVTDKDEIGHYRKDIPIHRTYFHEIAVPAKIEPMLLKVLDYLKDKHENDIHPIELASNVHHRFMRVFPFATQSGFIGRLMLNFVLMRGGLLPAVVHAADRQRYYDALRSTEREFKNFVAETMENSLDNALKFIESYNASQSKNMKKGA